MLATKVGGSFEGSSPQHITLFIAPLGKIVVEGSHRRIMDFVGNDPSVSGEADPVGQFDSAMVGD